MPIRMSGLSSGLDTDAIIKDLMAAQSMKLTKIEGKQTKLGWQQDKWKELNTKLYSLYTDKLSKLRLEKTYMTKKVSSTNAAKVTASASSSAVSGTHMVQVKQLASSQYVTGGKLTTDSSGNKVTEDTLLKDLGYSIGDEITITSGSQANGDLKTEMLTIDENTTLKDFVKTSQEAGLNASFDATQNRLFLSSKTSGSENTFQVSMSSSYATSSIELLGLGSNGTTVDAKDAIYRYNGSEFTSSSNTVTMNGLTFQLTGTTAGYDSQNSAEQENVVITVDNDVDAVYDTIKDFVVSYNEILKELNDLYYAKSARGYEPLTSEQKEEMTDEDIEKWEKKIKDSMFRGDSTMGSLITGMKSALLSGVTVNGKDYSMSSFGIMSSSDYSEKGVLHIYGDQKDSTYGAKDDKLKDALINDSENAIDALVGIFNNLYKEMADKMKGTTLSSALTFYNDKELAKTETKYKKDYSAMEKKLSAMEEKYYKQFTAMETAMAKLNSQQSALAGMLGTS